MNRVAGYAAYGLALALALGGLAIAIASSNPWSIPLPSIGMGGALGVDATSRPFLFLASFLWLAGGVYGIGYLRDSQRKTGYCLSFGLAAVGNLGLVLAQDGFLFYACFALMSFASYGLVVHNGDESARRAGKSYIIFAVIGELLILAGLVELVIDFGTNIPLPLPQGSQPSSASIGFLLSGFGVKAGSIGLHFWLPKAHPAAPVPASAILSGAMIKAGLLGWVRFLPLGLGVYEFWGQVAVKIGYLSVFYGIFLGLKQTNPKTVLAYSSVSQMGYLLLGVGVGLAFPDAWPALLSALTFYALHHAFAKAALFLSVGIAHERLNTAIWLGIGLVAVSMAGGPFTSGAAAKLALKSALASTQWEWLGAFGLAMSFGAVGTTLLLGRFVYRLHTDSPHSHGEKGLGWMLAPWIAMVAVSMSAFWFILPEEGLAKKLLSPSYAFSAIWPLVLGIALSWTATGVLRKLISKLAEHWPQKEWDPSLAIFDWILRLRASQQSRSGPENAIRESISPGDSASRKICQQVISWESRLRDWSFASMALVAAILGLSIYVIFG